MQFDEVLVVAPQGVRGRRPDQPAEDVDGLQLVRYEAPGGDLDGAAARPLQQVENSLFPRRQAEQGPRLEQVSPDALDQVAAVGEVLLAEREQVAPVGALRRGSEAEEEPGAEPVDEAPIGRGGRVVELVDDDVVEGVATEALEVGGGRRRGSGDTRGGSSRRR